MTRIRPSLAHNASPEAYGEAMVACQGYAPACSDAGVCLYDGMCFTASGRGFKAARELIADAIDKEQKVATRVWLKLALDALDRNQFLERGAIDVLRLIAIEKAVREQYGVSTPKGRGE